MSGFFDIKSTDWTVWAIFASVVLVFTGFTMVLMDDFGSPSTHMVNPVVKCTQTDYTAEITQEEKMKMAKEAWENAKIENPEWADAMLQSMSAMGPGGMMPMMMPGMMLGQDGKAQTPEEMAEQMILRQWGDPTKGMAFKNPNTGEYTVFNAMKCSKCGEIYFRKYDERFGDRCPKCNYSRSEEAREKNKNDKKEKQDRKKARKEKRKEKKKHR